MPLFSWSTSKREEDGALPTGGITTQRQQQQQQHRHSNNWAAVTTEPPQAAAPASALAPPPTSSAYIHQAGEGLISGTSERDHDDDDDYDYANGDHDDQRAAVPTFSIFTPTKPQEEHGANQQEGWSEDDGWDINDTALETSAEVDATSEQQHADRAVGEEEEEEEEEDANLAMDPIVEQNETTADAYESSKAATIVRFADEQHAAWGEATAEENIPRSPPILARHHTAENAPSATTLVPVDTIAQQQQQQQQQDAAPTSTTSTALAKPSTKFVFLSEEGSVPSQLHQLQETSMRRRHEFQSNVYDLELRVAALTAALARERMEREKSLQNLLPDHVYRPLQECMEDLSLQRDEARNADNSWMKLEGRLSVLDSHMTHSIHVDLEDAKLSQLDHLKDRLEQQVEPSMQMQSHKLDKRERSLFRKLEDLAGSMARKYQEERATRVAATKFVSSQIKTMQDLDKARADAYVEQCQEVMQQLHDEKETRQQQDVYMSRLVAKQEALMKQALLEAVGGEHLHE